MVQGLAHRHLSEVEEIKELPRDVEVVAYCRGRDCLMAYAAVDYLTSKGLNASRLNIGMSGWRLEQRPMVVENAVEELPQPRPRTREH